MIRKISAVIGICKKLHEINYTIHKFKGVIKAKYKFGSLERLFFPGGNDVNFTETSAACATCSKASRWIFSAAKRFHCCHRM